MTVAEIMDLLERAGVIDEVDCCGRRTFFDNNGHLECNEGIAQWIAQGGDDTNVALPAMYAHSYYTELTIDSLIAIIVTDPAKALNCYVMINCDFTPAQRAALLAATDVDEEVAEAARAARRGSPP